MSDLTKKPALRYFGDYVLLGEIARGGMGVVYHALQSSLDRQVAIKMIDSGKLAGETAIRRFQTEAEAMAALDHPNIVPIYEVGEQDGHRYFSMKLVDGLNLADEVGSKPMDPRRAAELVTIVARAVHYAHERGVLHRDLKPSNILLDRKGQPHVTDFGIAKLTERGEGVTGSVAMLGTPEYMAPEQATGKARQVTVAADVYSLGAVLYYLLTGQAPFKADTPLHTLELVTTQMPAPPGSLNRSLDRDLETICLKCLAKEPADRYQSAADIASELERYLRGQPILARPVGPVGTATRWCRRHPARAFFATMMVLLVATSGTAMWKWWQTSQELKRLRLDAQRGDQRAENTLGRIYYEGIGVRRDFAEAAKWTRQAAERGNPEAQVRLGRMYDRGEGVPQNRALATQWLTLGAGPPTNSVGTALDESEPRQANASAQAPPDQSNPLVPSTNPLVVPVLPSPAAEKVENATAPRQAAIFVLNRAGAELNDKVLFLEDQVTSRVSGKDFAVISRDDVAKAIQTYPTDKPVADDRNSLGTKLDRLLSDNSSAQRLAQNLGADFILFVAIGSLGKETRSFQDDDLGVKTEITTHTLLGTYRVVEGYSGGSVGGDTFRVTKVIRQSPTVQIKSDNVINDLLEDAAVKVADSLLARAGQFKAPARPGEVEISIAAAARDLQGHEITLPDLRLTEDNKVTKGDKELPVGVSATIEIDGLAKGTTPARIKLLPGQHKLRLTRPGFADVELTINAAAGLALTPTMQLSQEGFESLKAARAFLLQLDLDRKISDARAEEIRGNAQRLRQSGFLVNTTEAPKIEDKSIYLFR